MKTRLTDIVRLCWKVETEQIPSQITDSKYKERFLRSGDYLGEAYKAVPVNELEWAHAMAVPIVDQMNRTKVSSGDNPFRRLTPEQQLHVLSLFQLDRRMNQYYVFVAPSMTVAEAYRSRLALTYKYTTHKTAYAKGLPEIAETLASIKGSETSLYEDLKQVGLLLISECMGNLTALQRCEAQFISLLTERYRNGKANVFVLTPVEAGIAEPELFTADLTDSLCCDLIKRSFSQAPALGAQLCSEYAFIQAYCHDVERNTYVCRTVLSDSAFAV